MNSIEVTNSPPIKDENYEKTASLLKVIAASQTPNDSGEDKHTIISDINDNNEIAHITSGRGAYIPYHTGYEDTRTLQPVELQVTNLDQNIEQREMKRTITNIFREHVPILHVSVFFQSDGNMAASVRVPTPQDAQYAISQLHRKKVGFKRILISRNDGQGHNPMMLRSKVMALLAEVPGGKLQLFKFREMYEKRYHDSIGVSDLYKMKDVVSITEEQSGRMVHLHMHHQHGAQHLNGSSHHGFNRAHSPVMPPKSIFVDTTTCPIHSGADATTQIKGWAEKENGPPLPNVVISLSVLGPNIKKLIKGHGGSLPLATLKTCYEAEFEAFESNHDDGVPLEHLVTAVNGASIQVSSNSGVKILVATSYESMLPDDGSFVGHLKSNLSRFSGSTNSLNSLPSATSATPAQPLASQLALFSRELVDLLKTSPGCRMHFHKFIPMYHHFFGRQCRVADYGYTKLKDLFEALPHVVQIIGEGSRAMITLSHRAQVKRFTSDLLKVLKTQPSKQIALYDLPTMFEKSTHKTFKISDYGVCEIEDMIADVSETSVVISTECNDGTDDVMISIPKREQTNEEVSRTQKFAEECIELLKHVPECRLPFNKFIPAYHHHFGRQCRVADYGFTKLIELFEAIPTTIEITEDVDGERILQLTDSERLNVVGDHIGFLIKNNSVVKRRGPGAHQSIILRELPQMYLRQYGYALRPENFGESNLNGIIEKLSTTLRLDNATSHSDQESSAEEQETSVRLIDRSFIKILSNRVREILADEGKLPLKHLQEQFKDIYDEEIEEEQLKTDLNDLVELTEEEVTEDGEEKETQVQLVPLQLCGVRIQNLLKSHGDKMLMSEFEAAFAEEYSLPLCPGQYGFPGLSNLIAAFPDTLAIRGRGTKKLICYLREGRRSFSNGTSSRPLSNSFNNSGTSCSTYTSNFGVNPRPAYAAPKHLPPQKQYEQRTSSSSSSMTSSSNGYGYRSVSNNSWMPSSRALPPRSRPIPQMRFTQPPPNFSSGLGFGGSSGPGCGGGDFWDELAKFGIFPNSNASLGASTSGTSASNTRSSAFNYSNSGGGRQSPNTAFGSPPMSPASFMNGNPTSMLPTPHSPSPLLQNRVASTHFAFPPIWSGSSQGQQNGSNGQAYRRNEP